MWSRCRAAATFCQNWQSSRNRHTLYCTDGFLHWFNHYKRIFRWYSGFSISWLYGKSRNKAVQKTTSIKTNSEEENPAAHQTAVYTLSNRRLHSIKLHITVFYSENCVCVHSSPFPIPTNGSIRLNREFASDYFRSFDVGRICRRPSQLHRSDKIVIIDCNFTSLLNTRPNIDCTDGLGHLGAKLLVLAARRIQRGKRKYKKIMQLIVVDTINMCLCVCAVCLHWINTVKIFTKWSWARNRAT